MPKDFLNPQPRLDKPLGMTLPTRRPRPSLKWYIRPAGLNWYVCVCVCVYVYIYTHIYIIISLCVCLSVSQETDRHTHTQRERERDCSIQKQHGTFAGIDHMLSHKASRGKFKKTEILSSIFSDHSTTRLECEQLTHWKSPWCWERLRAEGEQAVRGWNGWMASLMQWMWT